MRLFRRGWDETWVWRVNTRFLQKCSSFCELLLFGHSSSCYCFRASGIVSVVCCIFPLKGIEAFMRDLTGTATSPPSFFSLLLRINTHLTLTGKTGCQQST